MCMVRMLQVTGLVAIMLVRTMLLLFLLNVPTCSYVNLGIVVCQYLRYALYNIIVYARYVCNK